MTGPLGEERLLPETTRQTVRRLVDVSQTRARLFSPDGSMIADSFLLSGPGGVVEMQPLAPLDADDSFLWRAIVGAYDWIAELLPNGAPLPPLQRILGAVGAGLCARCRRRWPARPRPPCAMPAAGAWC